MDLLLDTHILLWFLNGDKRLSTVSKKLINNKKNNKYISIASLWEISIKIGLKKLEFDGDTKEISELIYNNNFEILPITVNHTIKYEKLDFIHRDPFDRILISQAMVEGLIIITKDLNIKEYNVQTRF